VGFHSAGDLQIFVCAKVNCNAASINYMYM
jgi:hypothetical protein